MESLAALVAGIYVFLMAVSIFNIFVAVLYRRKKVKLLYAMISNVITGILAIWAVSTAWALGVVPFIGVVVASIVITWPSKKQR